jgi:hypothetical protein
LQHEVARQEEARQSIQRTALHSVIWSMLGAFCCLVPVFGVVGVVMALRARKMAVKYGLVIPATATLGLVLGILALLASIGVYTAIIVQEVKRTHRIEALEHRVAQGVAEPQLALSIACDLAELRLLKDGIAGKSAGSLEDFECTGSVASQDARAVLDDFSFRADSATRHHVKVCYRRGARWVATGFRIRADCDDASDVSALFTDETAAMPKTAVSSKGGAIRAPGSKN